MYPQTATATGSLQLTDAVVSTTRNYDTEPLSLCAASYSQPTPAIVHIDVRNQVGMLRNRNTELAYFAGQPSFNSAPGHLAGGRGLAFAVLEYHAFNVWRRIVCDLRSGYYQLPPVSEVRVSVNPYRAAATSWAATIDAVVNSAIMPGVTPRPTRPTHTCGMIINASQSSGTIRLPAGARWWDCWVETSTGQDPPAATSPILVAHSADDTGPWGTSTLIRDYVNEVFTPPQGPVELDVSGNALFQVDNTSAASGSDFLSWLRFYLEL